MYIYIMYIYIICHMFITKRSGCFIGGSMVLQNYLVSKHETTTLPLPDRMLMKKTCVGQRFTSLTRF